MPPLIQFHDIRKEFGGLVAVRHLDLSIEEGEVFAFLGPNGSGKTTAIRMMMGMLAPTSGTVTIAGLDCFERREDVMRLVGYQPENPLFHDFLTGYETTTYTAEMHGMPRSAAQKAAWEILNQLDLWAGSSDFAVNYSLGMKKKLALACALVHKPKLLILDEPTNGLDPRASHQLVEYLRALNAEGVTIFLCTHLLDMAEKFDPRVGIIAKGELRALGRLEELRKEIAPEGSLEDVFLRVTEPGQ